MGSGDDVGGKTAGKSSKFISPSRQAAFDVDVGDISGFCCSDTLQCLVTIANDVYMFVAAEASSAVPQSPLSFLDFFSVSDFLDHRFRGARILNAGRFR